MYIILVYDVGVERVGKVCKYLRTYLPRVQNSVFEGEISVSKLAELKVGLTKIIEVGSDSVLIWKLRDSRWATREIMGTEKLPIENFI